MVFLWFTRGYLSIRQEGLGMSLRASDPIWNFRGVDAVDVQVDAPPEATNLWLSEARIHRESNGEKKRVIWILWDIEI